MRSPYAPTYRGFMRFCADVGEADRLKPFQRRIARAHFGTERECVAILPRGSAKSTLAALLAVHHVLSRANPGVYIGAASREQARVIGLMVRALSRHEAVAPYVVWRTDALRWAHDPKGPAVLSIVAASGDKAHGWPHPTLIVADEVWAWSDREPTLLGAMMSAMLKNAECRFLGISTAAASLDSPLGRLRTRALAQPKVKRTGPLLEASGGGLRWIEHSLPEDADPEDLAAVAAANPLRTVAEMREQRPRVSEVEWLQFHCCRWGVQTARWLPPGAWQACSGVYEVGYEEPLVLGVDVGGSRSATAVVGCVSDGEGNVRVAVIEVWQGIDAVLKAVAYIEGLIASGRRIREVVYDPMRFESEAQRLERDHGIPAVAWPQTTARMTISAERLLSAVVEGRLQHPGDAELDQHVANAVGKGTSRGGFRLVKAHDSAQIDALIALSMACERAQVRAEPARVLGWA